jgi:hypothetical protein
MRLLHKLAIMQTPFIKHIRLGQVMMVSMWPPLAFISMLYANTNRLRNASFLGDCEFQDSLYIFSPKELWIDPGWIWYPVIISFTHLLEICNNLSNILNLYTWYVQLFKKKNALDVGRINYKLRLILTDTINRQVAKSLDSQKLT